MPYADYLLTPEWKRRRNHALATARYRCATCDARRELQVHHLAYERLGQEWDVDLEVLCRTCHEGHHFNESRKQHLGIYVKLVSEAIRAGAYTSFADLSAAVKDLCAVHTIPFNRERVTRALDALSTNRLAVPTQAVVVREAPHEARPIGRQEAAAILRRLGIVVSFKSMPRTHVPLDPGAVNQFRQENGLWR